MRQDWYEVLVLAARYWFALLGVIVVWRGFSWLRKEARQRKRKLRQLPDAGFIGAFHVIAGESRALRPGDALPVPMEGMIGSASGCDIRIQHPGVAGRHALFEFNPEGLRVRPFRDEPLRVDDQLLPQGCEAVLRHGAMLTLGAVMLQLRLFAGVEREMKKIDAPEHADYGASPAKKNTSRTKKASIPPVPSGSRKRGGKRQEDPPANLPDEDPLDDEFLDEEFLEEADFEAGPVEEESVEADYYFDEVRPQYDDNPIYGNKRRQRR